MADSAASVIDARAGRITAQELYEAYGVVQTDGDTVPTVAEFADQWRTLLTINRAS